MERAPYSHRNGETDEPKIPGYYWCRYVAVNKVAYAMERWEEGGWYTDDYDGYRQDPDLWKDCRKYGPIPEPKE